MPQCRGSLYMDHWGINDPLPNITHTTSGETKLLAVDLHFLKKNLNFLPLLSPFNKKYWQIEKYLQSFFNLLGKDS